MQQPDSIPPTSTQPSKPGLPWRDAASFLIGLSGVVLAWVASNLPTTAQYMLSTPNFSRLQPEVCLALYIIMYATLSLLAYRMRYGLYAGLYHIPVVAAFLTFGPAAALLTAIVGRILSELGRALFYRQLGLTRHSPAEAITSALFHAGAHTYSTLFAGLLYQLIGGTLPLLTLVPSDTWLATIVLFVANVGTYELIVLARAGWSGSNVERRTIGGVLSSLLFSEAFSLPLSLLLPIAFYNLPPGAFLMLVSGILIAGILFRISETARWSLERRVTELATLNSIGQSLTSSLNMTDLLQGIYSQVAGLVEAQIFYIALYTPDTEMMSFPLVIQDGTPLMRATRHAINGLSEYVISTGKTLLLNGDVRQEATKLGITDVDYDAQCFLGLPLIAGDETMGLLAVQSTRRKNAYGRSEIALLSTIATQAGIALRNANLFSRVFQMAEELTLINNLSSVVTATLDLDIVLDATCRVVIRLGNADKTAVFLISEDGRALRMMHSEGLSDDFVAQFRDIHRENGSALFEVLNQNAAMAITDVKTDPRGLGWRTLAEIESYSGLLTVPLIANDVVIGFLAAFYQESHLFGKSELDLMNTLANQVAVTVSNARLYEDTQARAQAMSRLVDASRAFTTSLDLNSVAQKVLDELASVLYPDFMSLLLSRSADGRLVPLAQSGTAKLEPIAPTGSLLQAFASRKAIMLPEHNDDLALLKQWSLESLYVIPLVEQERAIGLVLVGHAAPRHLTDRDMQLAQALVNQASVAVRNAQLYGMTDAALTDRVEELSAIEAISRQISGSLELDAIINDVLDTAIRVTDSDCAGFVLANDSQYLSFSERYPKASGLPPYYLPVQRQAGIIGRVLRTGEIARVGNVMHDPDYTVGPISDAVSELCVPIILNGTRLGAINVESRAQDAFSDFHERFLTNLADHAAIAISNARLFEERQIQIETLIKFRNFSLDLLSADSLKEVMRLSVEYALVITRAKDVHLYLYDRAIDKLTFGASLWLEGRENVEASKPQPKGRTWEVARSGKMYLIEDVTRLEPPPAFRNGPGFAAIARIPLKRGDAVSGVLNIAFREPRFFTDNEIRVFDLLANQAAIAIENARLFDEVRISRDRMALILNSTRDGLMLIGQKGELILANPSAEKLLNYPFQDHVGTSLFRLAVDSRRKGGSSSSLFKELHNLVASIRRDGESVVRQTFQIEVDGTLRDIETTILPVGNNSGGAVGRVAVLRDVSEEKSMERFREELTNMIVHDLRSPLSGVVSSLHLMGDMVAARDFNDFDQVLAVAINSSQNQMRMIESMLEIDKLESGHMPLHIDTANIGSVVGKAIAALEPLAQDAGIHVLDCVPSDLPALRIDEEQIRRVIVNLLDNALRHTPTNGQVRIEGSLEEGTGYAKLGVVDSGNGIPTELREHVFEKFVQVPKSALRGPRGIGLGLTFCKLAVETHGGHIWVESGPEGGAAFRFTLPVAETVSP